MISIDNIINGTSAIASLSGVFAAIWLAHYGNKKTQEQRMSDKCEEKKQRADVIQEACSASDQVVSYLTALPSLIDNLGSPLSIQALQRVREYLLTLNETLGILSNRPELSDGAIVAAVTARRVSKKAIELIERFETLTRDDWAKASEEVTQLKSTLELISERTAGVRKYYRLSSSKAAERIREKYTALTGVLTNQTAEQGPPAFPELFTTPY